ncbi:transposase [Streptomyces sp. 3211.6]|uniref:transposase n=1 Tax=Streptomyces sp. 3211.6 TaxID=1938845 RepID=UPI000F152673|nr:transposase [Streptomyces sp. 3211.6]RKT06997.1 transposase [Streptomyces sp. 3211.6]
MICRHELSDAEWGLIRPLLPRPALGRLRLDDRIVLNGIVWKFRAGVPWRTSLSSNVVERCFNRLKQWRGIATPYDKTAQSYKAAVTLASILMWTDL